MNENEIHLNLIAVGYSLRYSSFIFIPLVLSVIQIKSFNNHLFRERSGKGEINWVVDWFARLFQFSNQWNSKLMMERAELTPQRTQCINLNWNNAGSGWVKRIPLARGGCFASLSSTNQFTRFSRFFLDWLFACSRPAPVISKLNELHSWRQHSFRSITFWNEVNLLNVIHQSIPSFPSSFFALLPKEMGMEWLNK